PALKCQDENGKAARCTAAEAKLATFTAPFEVAGQTDNKLPLGTEHLGYPDEGV
ncbi:unnamed protein product, partial [Amoebophrya sp. A120]